jgi:predicted metalloprotease with PDZ domain
MRDKLESCTLSFEVFFEHMKSQTFSTQANIHYSIALHDLKAHLFQVTLTVAQPAITQHVSLPVWIPGSYLVREFAKNLQNLCAYQGKKQLDAIQADKCSWQIDCDSSKPLTITYQVFAHDNSVRTAWLDDARGFFNGTSLCLRVEGQEDTKHILDLRPLTTKRNWQVATGAAPLKINKQGFGSYSFANYDELVDCPFELGTFWSDNFTARGVKHRFVVAGATATFDGSKLLADTQKICETEMAFWHGKSAKPPFKNYVFMLNAVDDGYGGLEHRNSTALICNRKDLPRLGVDVGSKQSSGYTTLLGLISHEYFHTWNVKRLRPKEFEEFDYSQENYSKLLWFFEGFTSYYDDLLLRRAGLIDDAQYLDLLCKTANQVMQTPGCKVQTVAQASFDAWVKYYRPEPNTANATVSYYTKGALVALCFDLTLRLEGKTTLDDVMRGLWVRCKAGPMAERDFAIVLEELGGRSFAKEIKAWVHGVGELPVRALLAKHGVAVTNEPAQLQQRLGLRVTETNGINIKVVLSGGAAEKAGFAAGDEWLGITVGNTRNSETWRIHKLDDLAQYITDHATKSQKITAIVARDKRLVHLTLNWPTQSAERTWQFKTGKEVSAVKQLSTWLVTSLI